MPDRSARLGYFMLVLTGAVALFGAGSSTASDKMPGGDGRLDAIWQRKGPPVAIPAGVDLTTLTAEVAEDTPGAGASREILAGSLGFVELLEIAIDELEVRFYITGGDPLTVPLKKKVKGQVRKVKTEASLEWEGPVLVRRRRVEGGGSSTEQLFIGSDGTLRVELEWTGPPLASPVRVVSLYNRLSGGFQ